MPAPLDLIGHRFGLLVVLAEGGHRQKERAWRCLCDCGHETVVVTGQLRSGGTRSCGCRKKAVLGESTTTHGGHGTRTYRIWKAMRTRCNNPNVKPYRNYGGRGIRVCERWNDYANFLADMGPAPAGLSIDRKDVNGNYEPGNCRWATPKEQARNMRVNKMITIEGETRCLSEWAEELGTDSSALLKRFKRGVWP